MREISRFLQTTTFEPLATFEGGTLQLIRTTLGEESPLTLFLFPRRGVTSQGVDEILVPGEPENRAYEERSAYGIPLPEATAERLRKVGRRFEIEPPSDLT